MEPEKSMDATQIVLGAAALEKAASRTRLFLERVFGGAIDELSDVVEERARLHRFKCQVRAVSKAQQYAEDAGLTLDIIPMRLLFPLLQGAAIEDNPSMSDKWAALLANAATRSQEVSPSFPAVLTQLSPQEARLFDIVCQPVLDDDTVRGVYVDPGLLEETGLSEVQFNVAVDNLERLGLLRGGSGYRENEDDRPTQVFFELRGRDALVPTTFGEAFYRVCSPPVPG